MIFKSYWILCNLGAHTWYRYYCLMKVSNLKCATTLNLLWLFTLFFFKFANSLWIFNIHVASFLSINKKKFTCSTTYIPYCSCCLMRNGCIWLRKILRWLSLSRNGMSMATFCRDLQFLGLYWPFCIRL